MSNRSEAGLTIIEIMMLGIVAAIAISLVIPRLRASRILHNEEIAIRTFGQILEAERRWGEQLAVKPSSTLDETPDSEAGSDSGPRFAYLDELIEAGLLDLPECREAESRIIADGYVFEVFLFDRNRVPIDRNSSDVSRVDPDRYLLMAWPMSYGDSGVRAFAGFDSELLHSSNSLHRYQGLTGRVPTGGAPLMRHPGVELAWLGFGQGRDHQLWGPLQREVVTEE